MEDNETKLREGLEAELLEPRRPGRPRGAKNRSDSRTEVRRRVAAHRERKRLAAEAEEESIERTDRVLKVLRSRGFTLFGELEAVGPDGFPVNASTADEELMLAKEYAQALNLPGIRPGQKIRNFVLEVLRAHCAAGARPFNRTTRQFANDEFEGVRVDDYLFPDGCESASGVSPAMPVGSEPVGSGEQDVNI